ncbi:MAG: polyhydroxyalkanoate synthesis protein PhaF [Actinobacteria bacterium]|nr:polyhydroxyalkanoate synthesis protein PhaF [Actinomycetota bacterium]
MDSARGLMQLFTELSEQAVQRGVQLAAGLSAGMDGLDPTELPTRVAGMADDFMGQGRANTDFIVSLVRSEVDRSVGRMGFVREEELAALRRHVERLEAAVAGAGITVRKAEPRRAESQTEDSTAEAPAKTAAKKAPVKKAAAKKAPVKKAAAKKAPAKKSAAKKAPVKKSAAKKAPVEKADAAGVPDDIGQAESR